LLPPSQQDGSPWPRISVVTPSFNQAAFLEETIRSVLLQGYPNLEYIVVDGGSTDGSVDILRRYGPWLAYWVSEPDAGQTDAIRKGIRKASGEIVAWLNSDDLYCPDALKTAGAFLKANPGIGLLYGDCEMIDEEGHVTGRFSVRQGDLTELLGENFIPQPSTFCRRRAWEAVEGPDPALQYVMDYDLWIRQLLNGVRAAYLPAVLSRFRYHSVSKSGVLSVQFGYEMLDVLDRVSLSCQEPPVRAALPDAYSRTFRTILSLHEQTALDPDRLRTDVLRVLRCWADHLGDHADEYRSHRLLLADDYYAIGKHYCLLGYMEDGRSCFRKARDVGGKAFHRVLPARFAASMGSRSFRWYHEGCMALSRILTAGKP
jgi:glycosyltransferase involved in cell wall biosynthesis